MTVIAGTTTKVAAVTLGKEQPEPVGDDLQGASCAATCDMPLVALDLSLNVDEATFAELTASESGELAPENHVVELGVALKVRGDAEGRDRLTEAELAKLGMVTVRPKILI